MKPLTIPAATPVLLGRAAKPMLEALSISIADMIRAVPGVREAYLPQSEERGRTCIANHPSEPKRWLAIPAGLFVLWFLWKLARLLLAG